MINVHAFKIALNIINVIISLFILAVVVGSIYAVYIKEFEVLMFTVPSVIVIGFMRALTLGIGYCATETAINSAETARYTKLMLIELEELNRNKTNIMSTELK
ncbi:hypothetical protein [Photobacterium leiognathi]|uniref:hypothetical protein n=1 Tax=Photobacterium leiognathi TaxID=553611 RepID=UPI0029818DC4|nr:hypothetical protein [Photobacterium leiognathi]